MHSMGSAITAADDAAHGVELFDVRFAAVQPRLLLICRGLVGDYAEDVVHDAYLRGRGRIHQLRDSTLFDAWLTRIVVNLCFNLHRQNRRMQARGLGESGAAPAPERDLGLSELIEQLPPRDRTMIVLHYGYGYPLADIARLLGISGVNARTVLFRARARLGERLRAAEV